VLFSSIYNLFALLGRKAPFTHSLFFFIQGQGHLKIQGNTRKEEAGQGHNHHTAVIRRNQLVEVWVKNKTRKIKEKKITK